VQTQEDPKHCEYVTSDDGTNANAVAETSPSCMT